MTGRRAAAVAVGVAAATALATGSLEAQQRQAPAVDAVSFDGNRALDDDLLAAAIQTSASSWTWRLLRLGERRILDELELRRDVLRLELLYRQRGYYEATVDTAIERGPAGVKIRFRIVEGPPVVVDSVALDGADRVAGADNLLAGIPLRAGGPFDRLQFEAAADSIAFRLRDRGYPSAQVYRNYRVDLRARKARVWYVAVPGPRSRIGPVTIEGDSGVGRAVIARSLTFREGDWFRQSALFDSQRSLYQSGLFRYASVEATPDTTTGRADTVVPVVVRVSEAPPLETRVGVGYGTIDCIRAQGSMSFLNFLGGARRLDLTSRVSKLGVGDPLQLQQSLCSELQGDPYSQQLDYLGSVTLTQPGFPARRSALSVSGFAERRSELLAYGVQSVGAAVSVRFGLGRLVPFSLAYRVSRDQTTADPATYCKYFNQCDAATLGLFAAAQREASLTLTVVSTTTDVPLEPTTGHTVSLEVTSAHGFLGSEIAFDRVVGEAVAYHRLGRRAVLAARVRGGVIAPGHSRISDTSLIYVPPGERFYAGGPTTVRGYARNEMGPRVFVADSLVVTGADTTYAGLRAAPVGTYGIALANVELRLPTPLWDGRVGVNLFVDAGRLWDYSGSYLPGELRCTPGLGVQLSTPLGPMRVDAAYNGYAVTHGPLYVARGGGLQLVTSDFAGPPRGTSLLSRLQFHFSVGIAF